MRSTERGGPVVDTSSYRAVPCFKTHHFDKRFSLYIQSPPSGSRTNTLNCTTAAFFYVVSHSSVTLNNCVGLHHTFWILIALLDKPQVYKSYNSNHVQKFSNGSFRIGLLVMSHC